MQFDIFKGDNLSLVILWGFLIVFALLAWQKGVFVDGLLETKNLTQNFIFRLATAFLLAGFAQVLISKELIHQWLGQDSGYLGILIAWITGAVAPGGPFLAFPLLAVLYEKGASLPAIITFLSSWALIGGFRIITWELPFMGVKFVAIRLLVSFFIPPIIGVITRFFVAK